MRKEVCIYVNEKRENYADLSESHFDDLDMVVVRKRHNQCLASGIQVRVLNSSIDQAAFDGFALVYLDIRGPWTFERGGRSQVYLAVTWIKSRR